MQFLNKQNSQYKMIIRGKIWVNLGWAWTPLLLIDAYTIDYMSLLYPVCVSHHEIIVWATESCE